MAQTTLPRLDTLSLSNGDHVKPARKVSFKVPAPLSTNLHVSRFIPGPRTPIPPKHLARPPAVKLGTHRSARIRIRLAAKLGHLKNIKSIKTFKALPIRAKTAAKASKDKKAAVKN